MTNMMVEPRAIAGLRDVADRFDAVLLDQWGALHEGKAVFPAARTCVEKLHAAGKKILILSNSGRPARENVRRIADLGLPADTYDGAMTSGEVTWRGLRDRDAAPFNSLGDRCFLISRGNDRTVIEGSPITLADVAMADFILLSGLDDDVAVVAHWDETLRAALARKLPMLCANPDLTMFGATGLIPAPGALAAHYASLGGTVTYVGKPHAPIFDAALRQLGNPAPDRVVVIGDSLDHDILGGRNAGMQTVLITSGIHAEALRGVPDIVGAVSALADSQKLPHWIIDHLVW